MRFTPTHERVNRVARSLGISWQEAHQYVGNNSPYLDDFLINLLTPYEEKGRVMGVFFEFFSKPIVTTCFCDGNVNPDLPVFSGTYKQTHTVNDIVVCPHCGTGRLPLIPTNYADYYSTGYFAQKYRERLTDFDHELNVAKHRYDEVLKIVPKDKIKKVLDVGCAVGAFLNVLVEEGIEAVGTEVYNSANVYKKTLSDNIITPEDLNIKYTNGYFDVITVFDILEHVYDVKGFLEGILPFLKHNGFLIVEVPDMGKDVMSISEKNEHHIKLLDFEHVWYFTESGLKTLLQPFKLVIRKIERPIIGKMRAYTIDEIVDVKTPKIEMEKLADVDKIKIERRIKWEIDTSAEVNTMTCYAENAHKRIITLGLESGVGDVYWVLLKLQDFVEKNNIEKLKVYVQQCENFNRNWTLIESFPFVESVEYVPLDVGRVVNGVSRTATVKTKDGKTERLDYYFCLSDILIHGHRVETWLPEYKTDWNVKFKMDKPKGFVKKSPMVSIFASSEGLAKAWLNGFEREQWARLIDKLYGLGYNPVLIGVEWDKEYSEEILKLLAKGTKCTSMVGKTTLPEVLYILKESDMMIGAISGMTIMANHYRTPTVALYPEAYKREFAYTWIPPGYEDYLPIQSNANITDEIMGKASKWIKHNDKHTAKIGMLPGIGDVYWCLLKLEDYKKKNGIKKLKVYIHDSTNIAGRNFNRSGRLLDLVNFVDEYHYVDFANLDQLVDSAKSSGGLTTGNYTSVKGNGSFLFMYPNMTIDKGTRIEKWLPEYKTNFNMKIKSKDVKSVKQDSLILICSLDDGTCQNWLYGFGKDEWAKLVADIAKRYKTKPIIIGAEWDKSFVDSWLAPVDVNSYVNLTGKLSFEETCGLFKRANLLISTISGASIVANHFKTPTIALSPGYFHTNGFTHTWTIPGYKDYYSINSFKEMGDTILYLSDKLLGKTIRGSKLSNVKLESVYPQYKAKKKKV